MTYWVYEDDPTNRTRIHMATCNRCNDGRGTRARVFQIVDGFPFGTEREAIDRALSAGRLDARGCWFCLRGMRSLR